MHWKDLFKAYRDSSGFRMPKIWMIMQLTGIIMLAFCLQVSAVAFGQKVTIQNKNISLREVFKEIRKQTDYNFIFTDKTIREAGTVTLDMKDANLNDVLKAVFSDQPLSYTIENKIIIVKPKTTQPIIEKQSLPNQEITGVVSDSISGQPLVGVTVQVQNKNIGAVSDETGRFHLQVNTNDSVILILTIIGYNKKRIPLRGRSTLHVEMVPSAHVLNDLVVVGYGTQKEEKVLGAIQSIKPSQLTNTSSNLSTAFAGNIAGIIADQKTGEPGYDGAEFYIRGVQTFGTNKSPLLILDGVEISSAMLNNIPPESISSFSILKDATATALYGSRGANGVIIITTKEGHPSEKMEINIRFENTISMPTFVQDIANGVDYMTAYNEAVRNNTPDGETYVPFYSDDKIEGTRKHLNRYLFPDNNWYHTLFKDYSMNQNFNFNMSGGTSKVDYFLNFSFFNENGIVKKPSEGRYDVNINSQKYLFQSNVNARLTSSTRVALKMNTQLWYNNRPYEDITNLFYYSMRANPVRFPATLPAEEGDEFVRYGNNNSWDVGPIDLNPYALLSRGYAKRYYSWLTSVLTVDQDLKSITKGLHAKVLASFYNYTYSGKYRYFTPFYFKVDEDNYTINPDGSYKFTTEPIGDPGNTYLSSSVGRDGYHEYSLQGLVDYQRAFGKHDLGAMVVYRIKEKVLNTPSTSENEILPFREQGLAGRLTYGYDNRYLMEANFGYNGSENFVSGQRFGFFPSLAVGYIISNEQYFKPYTKTVNFLKLRASYGLAGNDALSMRFPYLTTVTMGQALNFYRGVNFKQASGPIIDVLGNENATWELAKKLNIGMDLGLFNAFSLSINYFHEDRSGIFMQRESLPTSVGLAGNVPYANIGKVSNEGIDLTTSFEKQLNRSWGISLRGTFTYAHNEVKDKDEPKLLYSYTSVIGHPINTIYGLISNNLFASQKEIDESPKQDFSTYQPGDIKYKDLNNDNRIDGNDITAIGYPTVPEIMYGLNIGLSYKKWDAGFLIQGAARVSLLMSNMHPFADAGHFGYGIAQYIVDNHWSEDNPDINASYPRLSSTWNENNVQTSTYWVRDASYVRLKNAEIGYRPNTHLRIYIAGTNLFDLSPFQYWDPEMGGGNGLKYPLQRTIKAGVQLHF